MPNLEYMILETADDQRKDVLEVMVNNALSEGWEPQGGIAVARIGCNPCQSTRYMQAMIRRKP